MYPLQGSGRWGVGIPGKRPFYRGLLGDLIDNFPNDEGEMNEVCFLVPYSAGLSTCTVHGPFVKQETGIL